MTRKRWIFVGLGLLLVVIVFVIVWYVFCIMGRSPFTNQDFTLTLARGWKEEMSAQEFKKLGIEAVKFNHDEPFSSIVIQKEPKKTTAVDFLATQKSLREKYPKEFREYQEVESHTGVFSGHEALFFNYDFTFEGKSRGTYRAHQETIIVLVGDTVYHVSVFLPKNASFWLRSEVRMIVDSIKFF